jgi:hypothetical protein
MVEGEFPSKSLSQIALLVAFLHSVYGGVRQPTVEAGHICIFLR